MDKFEIKVETTRGMREDNQHLPAWHVCQLEQSLPPLGTSAI